MQILIVVLAVLIVTRLFGELSVRIGQPALLGEIVSGIALGLAIGWYTDASPLLEYYAAPQRAEVLQLSESLIFVTLTDLGMFFLMLHGGLELRASDLAAVSWRAFVVALGGLLLPLVTGFALAWAFIPDSGLKLAQCLFVGTALAITAVPVSIKVLMDLGKLESTVGSIIVSAAVFDDVLSLLLLSVLTAVLETGSLPDAGGMLALGGRIAVFFAITIAIGRYVFPYFGRLLSLLRTAEYEFTALIVLAMLFAVLAEALGLHFIVGAFLAGLYFEKRTAGAPTYNDVESKIAGVTTGFLAPLFFASIGLSLDLSAVTAVPWFLTLLILCAVFAKLAGAGIPAYAVGLSKRDAVAVGVGMSGRGAVELIVAGIALRAGLFEPSDPASPVIENLFSAVVIVAIVTTLAVPILLRWVFRGQTKDG
jgi:Kef-type K+ transport system membrane component KefB